MQGGVYSPLPAIQSKTMNELKLYQKSYDFLIWMFAKTDGFPKSKRFSVGQRLENLFLDFIVLAYDLHYTTDNNNGFRVVVSASRSNTGYRCRAFMDSRTNASYITVMPFSPVTGR